MICVMLNHILLLAAAALGLWLLLTWYFADDEPLFGRVSEARVTFKRVLANAIADAREMFDRLTNTVFVGVSALAAFVVENDAVRTELMARENAWGLGLVLALALFTSPAARVQA